MRVTLLNNKPGLYSCNVYLVRGGWNRIDDMNTLIDVGTDGSSVDQLESINAGLGKSKVDQVVLTHEHFDHAGGLEYVRRKYKPVIYAYSYEKFSSERIFDGQRLRIGDNEATIIHTPGHTHDSLCIYCKEDRIIFSGDTTLNINTTMATYSPEFVKALEKIVRLKINVIYPGHGAPMTSNVKEILHRSLENVRKSRIVI